MWRIGLGNIGYDAAVFLRLALYLGKFSTNLNKMVSIFVSYIQQGQTPLHLAAENDHSDVVKLFLKHRPELVTMANTVRL